jgi:hypothetical protein
MKYLVKDHADLRKDAYSKVVTNENSAAFKNYIVEKQQREKQIQMEMDINKMRNDLEDIKSILRQLLEQRVN